jgi:hypothetical protein
MEEEIRVTADESQRTEEVVMAWTRDWFHNLALPVELQNRISEASRDLVRRLRAAKE